MWFLVGIVSGGGLAVAFQGNRVKAVAKPVQISGSQVSRPPVPMRSSNGPIDEASKPLIADRRRGQAILDQDIPFFQKLRRQAVEDSVSTAMTMRGAEYEALFQSYGLAPADTEKLLGHVAEIYRAKAELQNNATQLLNARDEYEKVFRALLGENAQKYDQYEMLDAPRRQYDEILKFAETKDLSIDPSEKEKIIGLIFDVGAYARNVDAGIGGVFQDWPLPASGQQAQAMHEVDRAILDERREILVRYYDQYGLSDQARKTLDSYYTDAVKQYADLAYRFSAEGSAARLESFKQNVVQRAAEAKARREAGANQGLKKK